MNADEWTPNDNPALVPPEISPETASETASETAPGISEEIPMGTPLEGSLPQQPQAAALTQEIAELQGVRDRLQADIAQGQRDLGHLIQDGLQELEQRRQNLQISIEQLERRQERIRTEMRTSFAGSSQEIAIRVQSFKEYLVGSLQDLAIAADQLNLPQISELPPPAKQSAPKQALTAKQPLAAEPSLSPPTTANAGFAELPFQEQTKRIRTLLDQYRNRPDYYGPPWLLRRTFEPIHAERVSTWFLTQGGRGAVRTLGSRLQNILITSAAMSILRSLYGDRARLLVLAQSPERLGEWRRGLQDCLGITRSDFGPDRGVALFEDPAPLALKADRLVKEGLMPFIAIDETEEYVSLAMLQFPLWLAFAPNPETPPNYSRNNDFW
jgi:hypothetical protein